jgi:hypothetical protein
LISPGIELTINKPAIRPARVEDITVNEQEAAVASRIARLVMTQLKAFLINFDSMKVMRLNS